VKQRTNAEPLAMGDDDLAELAQLLDQLPPPADAAVEPVGRQNNLDLISPAFTRCVDHLKRLLCRPESRSNGAWNQDQVRQGDRCSHFTRIGRSIC
jgi:hypothetical protein